MTFLDRMIDERDALSDKVCKLKQFLTSALFASLSCNHQELLERQFAGMMEYQTALEHRIDLVKSQT